MSRTWVVVAESARARFFTREEPAGALREVDDMTHPASRQHEQTLTADLPGRSYDSMGKGRHAMAESTDPKHHEAQVFSQQIAARLEAERAAGELDALLLLAPPEFLGLLREALTPECKKTVKFEASKHLVQHDVNDIMAHLPALH